MDTYEIKIAEKTNPEAVKPIMNKKQEEILTKEFKVNENFTITRSDYEDMPSQMVAWNWSDKKMQQLAESIERRLSRYDETNPDRMEEKFWETMESAAVDMGMLYYEDLPDEVIDKLDEDWDKVK